MKIPVISDHNAPVNVRRIVRPTVFARIIVRLTARAVVRSVLRSLVVATETRCVRIAKLPAYPVLISLCQE